MMLSFVSCLLKDRCSADCGDCCPNISICERCFRLAQVCDCTLPTVDSCWTNSCSSCAVSSSSRVWAHWPQIQSGHFCKPSVMSQADITFYSAVNLFFVLLTLQVNNNNMNLKTKRFLSISVFSSTLMAFFPYKCAGLARFAFPLWQGQQMMMRCADWWDIIVETSRGGQTQTDRERKNFYSLVFDWEWSLTLFCWLMSHLTTPAASAGTELIFLSLISRL